MSGKKGQKVGSYKGGRKPQAQRTPSLDRDREQKRLQRANKNGFATYAEYRKSVEAKEAARCAARFVFVETPNGREIQPSADLPPVRPVVHVQDYVATFLPDGVIRRDPLPPASKAEPAPVVTPAPTPVSTGQTFVPGRFVPGRGFVKGYWKPITSKEEREAAAGRREPCGINRHPNVSQPWSDPTRIGPIEITAIRNQQAAQKRMDEDNADRYW